MERSDVLNVVEKFALSRKKNNLDNQTSNRIGIKMERFAVASKKESDVYTCFYNFTSISVLVY